MVINDQLAHSHFFADALRIVTIMSLNYTYCDIKRNRHLWCHLFRVFVSGSLLGVLLYGVLVYQVLVLQVLVFGSQLLKVWFLGFWFQGSWFFWSWFLGTSLWVSGPRSRLLILDYAEILSLQQFDEMVPGSARNHQFLLKEIYINSVSLDHLMLIFSDVIASSYHSYLRLFLIADEMKYKYGNNNRFMSR